MPFSSTRPFDPQWTVGGPLDNFSSIDLNTKEERVLGWFESRRKDTRRYFRGLQKLVKKHSNSPSLIARLAVGHILLDDIIGALELFEKAHAFLDNEDSEFEEYLQVLRKFVKQNGQEEDKEWSEPEGSFIVSHHIPPQPISVYSFGIVSYDNVKATWNALLSKDKDVTTKRYSRLLAVESSEIEHVFLLGVESLPRIVRAGFYTGAIDRVLDSLSGKPDPLTVVSILKDFAQALETFTDILITCSEITLEHIRHLHALLMNSSMISAIILDGAKIDYLVPLGAYRRRLVTTTPVDTDIEGVVQFAKWQDIPGEMEMFASQLRDCLSSAASPFVKAAWIHSIFVGIHPFVDGNGRVARIIASIPLIKMGLPFINVRLERRKEYMQAVFRAQTEFNLQPLAELFVKSMEDSIQYITSLPPPSPDDKRWAYSYTDGSTRLAGLYV